ncbi:MAG: hypothetical protein GY810_02785, partial [Aureispira sp.]|nr:hypothetical protein [Aureispira sp.]
MRKQHYLWLLLSCLLLANSSFAQKKFINEDAPEIGNQPAPNKRAAYRSACIESKAFTELNINNVRARLRAGGDMWWDGAGTAQYIVPNVDPASGEQEISSLFASAIWLGAYDDGGNLILAAQTYRGSGNDYWTGPLNPTTGTVEKSDCEKWDRHFTVYGDDITTLRGDLLEDGKVDVKPAKTLLSWPARGNPHFAGIFGWELPDQDLAPFIDYNGDGVYDPWDGDHPIIEVGPKDKFSEPCGKDYVAPVYADQMVWWVYNDNGDVHGQSNGEPMKMEIQVTAFGYRSTDAINNMTFYRYKLLNRNALTLSDTYFSLWSDPDLGCFQDDYIGCDTITGMGYVYNADGVDDNPCGTGGGNGYGASQIPALGVDYFRGPIDSAGNQIGLSSFQYHVTGGNIGAPSSAIGYYRLISGFWPDGTAITQGNNGYNVGSTDPSTPYVFPSWPDDQTAGAWSMCSQPLSGLDQRFMHTSGPSVLKPGATNEMISGVVWVPEIPDYPCPSLKQLVEADQLAQNLFDNCFKITDGPDAPYIDVVELENELILNLGYTSAQNNFRLGYEESPGELRPYSPLDTTYNFQGYKVYQVNDPNISVTDLEDEEKARLIYQCDVKDSVGTIINWEEFEDESIAVAIPTVMVEGENKGLKHTFRILEDQFAAGEKDLVNHKPYYFCVVAYAHNEYKAFDPTADGSEAGQDKPYLQGRRNFRIYTGIPRKTDSEYGGLVTNATYGDQPGISRLDGRGTGGGNFLEIANREEVEGRIFAGGSTGQIDYLAGRAPISVKVVDPLRVPQGTFRLFVCDNQYTWKADTISGSTVTYTPLAPDSVVHMSDSIYWVLADVNDPSEIWTSFQTIDQLYEQYIPDLGISVTVEDAALPGMNNETGYVGSELIYADTTQPAWFGWVADEATGLRNMLKTGNSQTENSFDPESDFSETEGGFYPFMLADCRFIGNDYYL